MLLDKYIEIEIKRANVRFFKDKYKCKVGDFIKVEIIDLPKGTSFLVRCKCQICGIEKELMYRKYNKNISKYGYYSCSSKCSTLKKKKTFLNNYGVDSPIKNEEVKEKIKNTCIFKYGFDNPMKSEIIKNKVKNTCINKYNSDYFINSSNFKDIMLDVYGVLNPMESIELNNKRIRNSYKINKFTEIKYQSKYELDFIKFCIENNIKIIKPLSTINYIDNLGINRKYIPDFYLEEINLIVEIKSTYYYNINKENNILKKNFTILEGYNYIIIIDKNYSEFLQLYKNLREQIK